MGEGGEREETAAWAEWSASGQWPEQWLRLAPADHTD